MGLTVFCSLLSNKGGNQLGMVHKIPHQHHPGLCNIFIHLPGESGNSPPSQFYWRFWKRSSQPPNQ